LLNPIPVAAVAAAGTVCWFSRILSSIPDLSTEIIAPHVPERYFNGNSRCSGAVALMLQVNPKLTPNMVKMA
jgi:hypothetical protein